MNPDTHMAINQWQRKVDKKLERLLRNADSDPVDIIRKYFKACNNTVVCIENKRQWLSIHAASN